MSRPASSRPSRRWLTSCQPPVRSGAAGAIGDPQLDSVERALRAELAAVDQALEQRHLRQSLRQSTALLSQAPAARPTFSPEGSVQAPAAARTARPAVELLPVQHSLQASARLAAVTPREQARSEASAGHARAVEHAVQPCNLSIVRAVTTATGTGCKDVVAPHASAALPAGACWTSRAHRVLVLESSCILQLWGSRT